MKQKPSPLYAATLLGVALLFALGLLDVSNLASGRGVTAQVISAFSREKNPYSIALSKTVPGVFTFNYQYAKTKSKKGQANFDLPIMPFDEKLAERFLPPGVNFGPHRDAWGYPVRENAYQKIALGKSPKERTALQPKIAFAADPGTVPGLMNCRANTSVTGYFEAYFEDVALDTNVGYDDPTKGAARRAEACQVLQDIAALIKLDQTTVTPDILFAVNSGNLPAGALAAASAYSGYYDGGSDNGSLSKHIISRVDPTPGTGNFDAFVITNFNGVSWDIDSSLSASTYDFYTVIYHEVLHALGFRSLLPAVINTTNNPYPHTTFDLYTYKDSSLVSRFFNAVSEFLQVPVGAPSAWFITNTNVYQGMKNTAGGIPDGVRPVYSPVSWEQGSSLSHFDMNRAGGKVYVMNPSISTNTIRAIHADEKEVLCHEGYQVSGLSGCEYATPWAEKDNANISGPSATPVATCINLLANDFSLSGGNLSVYSIENISIQPSDVLSYYSGVGCTGVQSNTFSGASSVKLTPSTSTLPRSFVYTVLDSVSQRISFPAVVQFIVASCSSNPDEYICNGDFEQPFFHNAWFNQYPNALGLSLFEDNGNCSGAYCAVPFWNALYGTADIFSSFSNFYSFFRLPLGTLNSPQGGSSIARILVTKGYPQDPNYNYYEPIITRLKNPLIIGKPYKVSFDAIAINDPNNLTYIDSNVTQPQYCIGFDTAIPQYLTQGSWMYAVSAPLYNSCQSLVLNPVGHNWTHVSYTFTPTVAYTYFIANGEFQRLNLNTNPGISIFFDNFSITPVSSGSISGKVYVDQNSDGSLNSNESGLSGVQVAIFAQNSPTPLQIVHTQNTPQLGDYTFTTIPDGTYNIALMGENIYSQITEPLVNNPVLQNGYVHVRQVVISGGQTISNKNFGVVLAPDLCPNLSGVQTTMPYGYQDLNGQCVQTDVCSNISGAQVSVPIGYTATGSICDACTNIDGVQSSVPNGYTNVSGQCIQNTTDTTSVTDICPNISGVQTTVPTGYVLVLGKCIVEPTAKDVCPNINGVQSSVPKGYVIDKKGNCVAISYAPTSVSDSSVRN